MSKLNEELWGNYIVTCDGCFNYLTKHDHFDTIEAGKSVYHFCHANKCNTDPEVIEMSLAIHRPRN